MRVSDDAVSNDAQMQYGALDISNQLHYMLGLFVSARGTTQVSGAAQAEH